MHSAQRARALDRLCSPRGVIAGAAVDHRDSLQAALAKRGLALDDAGVTELKLRVAAALAPAATLILLDAELSAAQAIAAGVLPGETALVVPLEAMGYGDVAKVEVTAVPRGLVGGKGPPAGGVRGEAALALPGRRARPGRGRCFFCRHTGRRSSSPQRVAVALARARNLDPDHPHSLTRSVVLP